jgi:tRNA pseudouridine13 synthase
LSGNRFQIAVRQIEGDLSVLEARLARVAEHGVPNYFGEQRFGRGGNNLMRADGMLRGRFRERNRHKRGLYLSAARSWLYNRVLAVRVEEGSWNRPLPGDAMILDGRRGAFTADPLDQAILARCAAGEIHPSGPLWGRGERLCSGPVRESEDTVLGESLAWREGLEAAGLEQERRALRLPVREMQWTLEPELLRLAFRLDAGAYATAVLREIVEGPAE